MMPSIFPLVLRHIVSCRSGKPCLHAADDDKALVGHWGMLVFQVLGLAATVPGCSKRMHSYVANHDKRASTRDNAQEIGNCIIVAASSATPACYLCTRYFSNHRRSGKTSMNLGS